MQWRREARRDDDMLLADLSELREIMELASCRLAALRRTPEDLEDLSDALDAIREAGRDTTKLMAADVRFHLLLLRATHNELMERLDVLIIHAVGAKDRILHQRGKRWTDPIPEHLRVFNAIKDGDEEGAYNAMLFLLRGADIDLKAGEPPFSGGE
jgi:DNA-binding FadR family transcriptional regulator